MYRIRQLGVAALLAASVLVAILGHHNPPVVSADTQFGPYGDSGKTYQNNWAASCRWWAGPGIFESDGDPCYRGVWSDTDTGTYAETAKVNEYAEHHGFTCQGQTCIGIYIFFGSYPASETASFYADVSHYYPGYLGNPSNPVDVRGYAHHWNLTFDSVNWWTTSDGY